jgi:hypothetical protein
MSQTIVSFFSYFSKVHSKRGKRKAKAVVPGIQSNGGYKPSVLFGPKQTTDRQIGSSEQK